MATNTGTWSEFHEAEWLGGCSTNDFPDIDAKFLAKLSHFVDQCDVDVPEGIFQKLGSFRFLSTLNWHYGVDKVRVEANSMFSRFRIYPTHQLWGVFDLIVSAARINTFRTVSHKKVGPCS